MIHFSHRASTVYYAKRRARQQKTKQIAQETDSYLRRQNVFKIAQKILKKIHDNIVINIIPLFDSGWILVPTKLFYYPPSQLDNGEKI